MQCRSPLSGLVLALAVLALPLLAAGDPVRLAQAEEAPSEPPSPPPDSDIEEIVVIGSESESSADFASGDSVTGFGAEDLAALGAQDIADIASFTPNLEIVTSGATTPTFFIRGVGLNDFNPTSTGAVAIYRDDVAINAPAIQLPTLFDVEAVNVLRGPQGTGLARNASAGAIKIYSRKPSGDFGGFLRSDIGNFDYRDFEGAVEAPIYEDLLAGRFAFRLSKRDGLMENRCGGAPVERDVLESPPGATVDPPFSICGEPITAGQASPIPPGLEDRVNDLDNWAARGTLRFQPTLDQTWLVNAHGARRDQLSELGQSIGTGDNFIDPATGEQVGGLLGGPSRQGGPVLSNNRYNPREIRARFEELRAVFPENEAKIRLSDELADDLDGAPFEGDFNRTGPTTNDSWGGYLRGEIVLPGAVELTTIAAYDAYDRLTDVDLDFSPLELFEIVTDDEGWQAYYDLSFKGELGEESPLSWEVGGWFMRERIEANVRNFLGDQQAAGVDGRDYTQKLWSAAGYGSFAFDFWEDFSLDGGVRYNWEQKTLDMFIDFVRSTAPQSCVVLEDDQPGAAGPLDCNLRNTWQDLTGTIRLTYRFREDTHAYWKYTRGWKPGTFNATASGFTGPTTADPESIDSFETGVRGRWLEGRLGLDTALFYYSYSDYQIFTARQNFGGTPEFVILNAEDAEVAGAEVDATGRPWPGAFANVRVSWLETQFLDFVQRDEFQVGSADGGGVKFVDRQNSGNRLLNSPQFKVSITAEQSIPLWRYGTLSLRYDGVWTDTTYFDASEGVGLPNDDGQIFKPDNTIAQSPYWLHNLRLGWRHPSGQIEVAGWVRNLTDQVYKSFAFDASNFRKTTIFFVGERRTYGMSASFFF